MFTETATMVGSIDQHIKALGLFSVSSYKLWCKRNSFSMSLEKTEDELTAELDCHQTIEEPSDPSEVGYFAISDTTDGVAVSGERVSIPRTVRKRGCPGCFIEVPQG